MKTLALAFALAAAANAHAGRPCDESPQRTVDVERGHALAARTAAALDASGAQVVAYPWRTHDQQSNPWALETPAGAMNAGANDRRRAQAWLQLRGCEPTTPRIDPLTSLGGRPTRANIAFDDHPNHKRFADRIETVTADSVFEWLLRSGRGERPVAVR